MDTEFPSSENRRMSVRGPAKPQRRPPTLFIGQWVRALGYRPIDVVRATGLNEGYLSELIAGRKTNPSNAVLHTIATAIGIPWHYLLRPPPSPEFLEEAATLDPAVLVRLRSRH
jgi:transcriptional regulator with XRE-family HTH domain